MLIPPDPVLGLKERRFVHYPEKGPVGGAEDDSLCAATCGDSVADELGMAYTPGE